MVHTELAPHPWFTFVVFEPLLTAASGIYAMYQPLTFLEALLPAHLRTELSAPSVASASMIHIAGFLMQLYGVLLILLALAEHQVCRERGPGAEAPRRGLLVAMAVADVLHIAVFVNCWCFDGELWVLTADYLAGWSSVVWASLAGNVLFVAYVLLLRMTVLLASPTAGGGPARRSANKRT